MQRLYKMIIALSVALSMPTLGWTCTVFVLDDDQKHYYGSNYDWHTGVGYVLVNPRHVVKKGWPLADDPGTPMEWTSKYGSVTFVQYGRDLPKGGMNEAGLAIEGLILMETQYPQPDDRPYIGSTSHFKQYLLDTCATVADVIEQLRHVRPAIASVAPGIHFMVADASGDCAVIAYIDGRANVYRQKTLPVKALTNHPYDKYMQGTPKSEHVDFNYSGSSIYRRHLASKRLQAFAPSSSNDAVAYAMQTLDQVSVGRTQWRVVYDQNSRRVYWRCHPEETIRWLDLKRLNFKCGGSLLGLPVQRPLTGEVNHLLSAFTLRHNRDLVRRAFGESRNVIPLPESQWEEVWLWPENQYCTEK